MVLSAMWYEDDHLTGGDWTAGVRFEIPLDRKWRESFQPPPPAHLLERPFEPVGRQNAAIKVGQRLEWDPENERFLNSEEANQMLSYEYRKPWKL